MALSGRGEEGTRCQHRRHRRGAPPLQERVQNKWRAVWLNYNADMNTMLGLVVAPETVLVVISSIASVTLFRGYTAHISASLVWAAASFMLALPLQDAIGRSYKRREAALQALASFRAALLSALAANSMWDWPEVASWQGGNAPRDDGLGARKKRCDIPLTTLWEHQEQVQAMLVHLADAIQELLLVPRCGCHEFWPCIRPEKEEWVKAELQGREHVLKLLGRTRNAAEALRQAGLPAHELSRIIQCSVTLVREFERLWSFKAYRTPAALRVMTRIATVSVPFFLGPCWLHVAEGDSGAADFNSVVLACCFASTVSLLMVAMFNLGVQMENPFRDDGSGDTIHVKKEMELCRKSVIAAADGFSAAWREQVEFEWEIVTAGGGENSHISDEAA